MQHVQIFVKSNEQVNKRLLDVFLYKICIFSISKKMASSIYVKLDRFASAV